MSSYELMLLRVRCQMTTSRLLRAGVVTPEQVAEATNDRPLKNNMSTTNKKHFSAQTHN